MFHNATIEEIKEYLKVLKKSLKNRKCKLIVHWSNDKNEIFKYLYGIKNDDVKRVLLSLRVSDFSEKKISNHPNHIGEELYVFDPVRDFVAANGDIHKMKMYIKIHVVEEKTIIDVISFHEFGEY